MKMLDDVLSERGVVGILTYILNADSPPYILDLEKFISNAPSRNKMIERIEYFGLITLTPDPLRPVRRRVSLTEKGKRVAALLKEAQDIVESD